MRTAFVVAKNTFKEIIRDRILYGLLVVTGLLIFIAFLLGGLSFAEQAKIITDLGLAAAQISCVMLAVFVGGSLVWREIDKQTVLTLLSKPVTRTQFIFGKVLGLGFVLLLMDVLISSVLAVIFKLYGEVHWYQFVICQVMVTFESLLILCFAVFFGVFSKPVMTVIFTLCCWLIGRGIPDLYFFSQKSQSPLLKSLGYWISSLFPNLILFDFKTHVVYGDPIEWPALQSAMLVWLGAVMILLTSANMIFRKRDFI